MTADIIPNGHISQYDALFDYAHYAHRLQTVYCYCHEVGTSIGFI